MKICPKCNISVGGKHEICPICQNGLEGEVEGTYYWPPLSYLKKQSLFYKLQLLIVLILVVVSLGLDFLIELHGSLHWSVIVAIWGISLEIFIKKAFNGSLNVAKVVSRLIITGVILLLITAWYANFWYIAVTYIVPGIVIGALITNFVLALIDKKENAMVYLLVSVLGGCIPVIGMLIINRRAPILWSICIMLSVVSVISIAVFKGGKMLQEIRKRTNI